MYVQRYDNNQVIFGGTNPNLLSIYNASKHIRDNNDKYDGFKNYLLYIIDGSGTQIYKPVDQRIAKANYCFWKSQSQLRWYVVTDCLGSILFVSGVYEGKLDDTTVLENTHFYE